MTWKLASLAATALVLATLAVALTPTASAAHNCPLENYSVRGPTADIVNPTILLADQACDGYHGGACDGKYLDYGWYGIICI